MKSPTRVSKRWQVRTPSWQTFERTVKFVGGMSFFGHEVFIQDEERPYLLVAILGLLGLTEMIRLDRKKDESAPSSSDGAGRSEDSE